MLRCFYTTSCGLNSPGNLSQSGSTMEPFTYLKTPAILGGMLFFFSSCISKPSESENLTLSANLAQAIRQEYSLCRSKPTPASAGSCQTRAMINGLKNRPPVPSRNQTQSRLAYVQAINENRNLLDKACEQLGDLKSDFLKECGALKQTIFSQEQRQLLKDILQLVVAVSKSLTETTQGILIDMSRRMYNSSISPWMGTQRPIELSTFSAHANAGLPEISLAEREDLNTRYGKLHDFPITVMSLDYLRKWGFEEYKTGQIKFSENDCFVRSISAILCINPRPLYESLGHRGSSIGSLVEDINKLIKSEDDSHEAIYFDSRNYWGTTLEEDPQLVANLVNKGGEGSYIAITESAARDSQSFGRSGHATVLTIEKIDGKYRLFTSDFQTYLQYEGLPTRHIIPHAQWFDKNKIFKFSFIKITNTVMPRDIAAQSAAVGALTAKIKLCHERQEAQKRVSNNTH